MLYEKRMLAELADKWPSAETLVADRRFSSASVLFVDVVNFPALAEKLSSTELSEVVREFYKNAGDTVNHGLRAARAALGLIDAAQRVQGFSLSHFSGRSLPRFEICVGLNSGPVTLAKLEDPLWGSAQVLPVGDSVSTALQLQKQATSAGWKIAASATLLREVAGAVKTGRRKRFSLPGRSGAVDGTEVLGVGL